MSSTSSDKIVTTTPCTLYEYCLELPEERKMWISARGCIDTASVRKLVNEQQDALIAYRGARVALQFDDDLLLAKALLLLDGVCGQLLLLPAEVSSEVCAGFLENSNTELLLTDSAEQKELIHTTQVVVWDGGKLPHKATNDRQHHVVTQWILATSGTTGIPKLVMHTLKTLTRSVIRNLEKGHLYRWALLYELSRFAGLQVFFQTVLSGSSLLFTDKEMSLEKRVAFLAANHCNAISATPSLWRKLLMGSGIEKLPLLQITLGGEIADQKLLSALAATFPKARIVHIYASTEAGVGFAVKDGRAGFPVEWLDHPPVGMAILVDDEGVLYLRSDCQDQSYLSNKQDELIGADGFICSGDLVKREGDRFYFLGRSSGAINVGGNKVHPEEVESVVLGFSGVQLCRVYGKANPFIGQLVIAEIVPSSDLKNHNSLTRQVTEHCRSRLPAFKVPAMIRIVDSLEFTATGKVVRT